MSGYVFWGTMNRVSQVTAGGKKHLDLEADPPKRAPLRLPWYRI